MASNSTATTTNTTAALSQVGIIPEFSCATDDWTIYREILEEFFKANAIPEGNKVSVLVSVIGADTYRILRDLCHPETPNQKTYEQLCALLAKQFIPEIAIFRERAKFYRAEQRRGEDVKAWYARLKKLSVDCKFGEHLEPLLLDKFVVGLASGPVLDRLCEENETLTLKAAVDLAANRESALQDEDMAEGIVDLTLDEHGHHRGKHHHRHPHHHPGPHGRFGPPGPHHGHHGFRGHHGPPGPHDFGWGHGFGPHQFGPRFGGPAERRGPPPFSPEFARACHRFGGRMERGCPFKQRSREMKRWAKKWRKHARYMASSSSSSGGSSNSSSSSSSDSNSSDDEEFRRKHHKGHKDAHGRHAGPHGFHGKKHGHGKRCQRKEKPAKDPAGTENTEPELIE